MTDKQIIIDGCDVSGCSLYEDNPKYRMWGTCDCMRSMVDQSGYDELAGAECKGYNCYYKQLKCKEQKNEELKQTLTEIKEIAEICCKTTDCKKCKFFEICENNCVDVILQKISESEVENERKENCN